MNYIRGALSASLQYYRDINPSTLTGAIDVIVIRRTTSSGEEELACSPFHVRFGKWQVLRPVDKKVKVFVNDEEIPYFMKVGDAGEAFFVFETDEDVPQDLITSPILQPTEPGQKTQDIEASQSGAKEDEEMDGEPEGEPEPLDLDSPSLEATKTPRPSTFSLSGFTSDETSHSPSSSTGSSPGVLQRAAGLGKAVVRAAVETERDKQQRVQDEVEAAKNVASHLYLETKQAGSTDLGDEALPQLEDGEGEPPTVKYSDDVVFDMEGYHTNSGPLSGAVVKGTKREGPRDRDEHEELDEGLSTPRSGSPSRHPSPDRTPNTSRDSSPDRRHTASPHTPYTRSRQIPNFRASSEPPEASPDSSPHYSWEWGGFPTPSHLRTSFTIGPGRVEELDLHRSVSVPPELDLDSDVKRPLAPVRSKTTAAVPGSDGDAVYPSPPSTPTPPATPTSMTSREEVEKGELTADVNNGRRFLVTLGGRTYEFELSICEDLTGDEEVDRKKFKEGQVSFRRFMKFPGVVRDQHLVMRWNDKYITRADRSLLIDSLSAWRESALAKPANASALEEEEPLSSSDEREPGFEQQKSAAPKKGSSSWVRWWRSSRAEQPPASTSSDIVASSNSKTITDVQSRPMLVPSASEPPPGHDARSMTPVPFPEKKPSMAEDAPPKGKRFAKTLRLTSDQLKNLNLKPGSNSITFSLSATGTIACTARIFVWESTDKIVVSDIDGTITKSDALGHVFTMIGRDWTHIGVAKLYTDIVRNGYKIMYLTSRAIGQADSTRDYLKGINQNNYQLPEGPVIMSPDRLMASLHREVILRKPEVFKMACLRDIQSLFGSNQHPFYAGFGNRITDALSYRSVDIPSHRIFTIDSTGEVKMELLEVAGYKSSYIHLTDLVDQMFPPIHQDSAPEFTDFNYWKTPLREFELPDLSPPSPTLSARSDTSNQSTLARLRNFSLGRQSGRQILQPPAAQYNSDAASAKTVPLRSMTSLERLSHRFTKSMDTFEESSSSTLVDSEDDKVRDDKVRERQAHKRLSMASVPGSLDYDIDFGADEEEEEEENPEANEDDGNTAEIEDPEEAAEEGFDEDFAATGEMESVPYL